MSLPKWMSKSFGTLKEVVNAKDSKLRLKENTHDWFAEWGLETFHLCHLTLPISG